MQIKSFNKIILICFLAALFLIFHSRVQAACVNPSFGLLGQTMDVTITGSGTHFDDTSQVSFSCQGITVNSVTANSATEITANITIACDAVDGSKCDVEITTGSETESCKKAFELTASSCICSLDVVPSTASADETLDMSLTVPYHDVRAIPDLGVRFSCTGIMVNSVTANSADTVRANITIAADAAPCSGYVQVTGHGVGCECGLYCSGEFSIWGGESPCWVVAVSPAKLRAGFILPRWYLISISAAGAGFTSESTMEIEGVRFLKVINTSAAGDVINAWVIIPPRFIIKKGSRQVTITTGDEVCTGVLEIQ